MKKLFAITLAIMILTGCSSAPAATVLAAEPPAVEMPTPVPSPTPAPTLAPTPSPMPTPEAKDEELTASTLIMPIISGSAASVIRLSLQDKFGIEPKRPGTATAGGEVFTNEFWMDNETGVVFDYSIEANKNGEISAVDFLLVNGAGLKPDLFKAVAEYMLSFCATVPYDTADPDKAMEFVSSHIGGALKGKESKTTIGGAVFEFAEISKDMRGKSVIMYIKAIDRDAYIDACSEELAAQLQ